MKRVVPVVLSVLSYMGALSEAQAAPPGGTNDDNLSSYARPATERRGGFTAGFQTGVSLLGISGYPNRVAQIGQAEFETSTGTTLGSSFQFWLGGALRDWITVGLGAAAHSAHLTDYQASTIALSLHVEGFPFYAQGGPWRDWGWSVDAGLGTGAIYAQNDSERKNPLADGASMSLLSLGTFYEPWQWKNLSFGPSLTWSSSWSQTLTAHQLLLGFRVVFYGKQP